MILLNIILCKDLALIDSDGLLEWVVNFISLLSNSVAGILFINLNANF